jgi:hypothetical protein
MTRNILTIDGFNLMDCRMLMRDFARTVSLPLTSVYRPEKLRFEMCTVLNAQEFQTCSLRHITSDDVSRGTMRIKKCNSCNGDRDGIGCYCYKSTV